MLVASLSLCPASGSSTEVCDVSSDQLDWVELLNISNVSSRGPVEGQSIVVQSGWLGVCQVRIVVEQGEGEAIL